MVLVHHFLATAVCAGLSTAHLMGLVPRDFDEEKDVDLGVLDNMDAFFQALGTNSSEWKNITPERQVETLGALPVWDEDALARAQAQEEVSGHDGTPNDASPSALFARQNGWVCDNVPEQGKFICENMPNTKIFWGFGALYAIYYSPTILNNWLNTVANLVYGGSLYERYARQNGVEGPIKARHDLPFDARVIHFKLEDPGADGLSSRDVDMEGYEGHVYTEYQYDTVKEEISASALVASLSIPDSGDAGARQGSHLLPRQSTDYNILLDIVKSSKDSTSASRSCIAKVLKSFINRSTEYHRHSCQQMHNSGSAMYHVGVHVNQGRYNSAVPRYCC